MTTIAYRDGIIAYDSRSTAGPTIIQDKAIKKYIRDGVIFFISGAISDIDIIIESYFIEGRVEADMLCHCIVVDDDKLFIYGNNGEVFFKEPLDWKDYYTVGSGSDYAWTALDLGCSAKEAVKMAAKRDSKTGGKIRTYKVKL